MRYKFIFFTFLSVFFISLTACKKAHPVVQPAFYHWQTKLQLDSIESTYLSALSVQRLYVKFFDVIWQENKQAAIPTAVLQVNKTSKTQQISDIIPTVFITNQVFKHSSEEQINELPEQVWMKIKSIQFNEKFKEIQIDCDWTLNTRDVYFRFLRQFKKQIPSRIALSDTIRLHQ